MSGYRSEAGRLFKILRETPVAKSSVCSRNSEDVGVSGAKLGASGLRSTNSHAVKQCSRAIHLNDIWNKRK